jgi:hypothetical protein
MGTLEEVKVEAWMNTATSVIDIECLSPLNCAAGCLEWDAGGLFRLKDPNINSEATIVERYDWWSDSNDYLDQYETDQIKTRLVDDGPTFYDTTDLSEWEGTGYTENSYLIFMTPASGYVECTSAFGWTITGKIKIKVTYTYTPGL